MQSIVYTKDFATDIHTLIDAIKPDRIFVLTDTTTEKLCKPKVVEQSALLKEHPIVIEATDVNKTLDATSKVWQALVEGGATRHSLLICLGGGMVTDLGGFAAATFKRGIAFINIPTTLLAMVDASVGGKTGINFCGLKNEIGAFQEANAVVIDTKFLNTLDNENLRSGYAEMLKHALLSDVEMWRSHLTFDLNNIDYEVLQLMVEQSINVKQSIVKQDPTEKGLRKALNLGHTTAHALESFAMQQHRPILHGYAVAWGLAGELFLSHSLLGFPLQRMRQTVQFIKETYGRFHFTCEHYEYLHGLMLHDKKNVGSDINFTLLADVGDIRLDQKVPANLLYEMFDFLREG